MGTVSHLPGSQTTSGADNSGYQSWNNLSFQSADIGREKPGQVGRRRGGNIFHLHSPADTAPQRNLSLDSLSSQLSLLNAANLAVILHWLTFCPFILGNFHLMIFIRVDRPKTVHAQNALEVQPSDTSLKRFKGFAWLTWTHLSPPWKKNMLRRKP